jgi:hypothetical protein
MKTPREILFARHRRAEVNLDHLRRKVLAGLPASGSAETCEPNRGEKRLIRTALTKAWLELIWPSRRAWVGIAALWLIVGAANLAMKAGFQSSPPIGAAPVREMAQGFEERRRLLAELLPPVKPVPPIQPSRSNPGPRSEGLPTVKPC